MLQRVTSHQYALLAGGEEAAKSRTAKIVAASCVAKGRTSLRHGECIAVLTLLVSALSDWRPEVGFVQIATTNVQ